MIARLFPLALAATALAGCATVRPNADGTMDARLGQTVKLFGMRVTPLQVLEDSRCPMEARCVWAGRVKVSARIVSNGGTAIREIATDKPLEVDGGQLSIAGVVPPKSTQHVIKPGEYRFTLGYAR